MKRHLFSNSVNKKNKYNGCNVTGNENGLAPVAVASSAKLSGKLPVSLGTPFKANGGDVSQLSIEGSDVDLYIDTPRALTIIEAESLGGDQWEVVHLDDPNRIFSFNDGDIVRGDAIRNPLIKLALSQKVTSSFIGSHRINWAKLKFYMWVDKSGNKHKISEDEIRKLRIFYLEKDKDGAGFLPSQILQEMENRVFKGITHESARNILIDIIELNYQQQDDFFHNMLRIIDAKNK